MSARALAVVDRVGLGGLAFFEALGELALLTRDAVVESGRFAARLVRVRDASERRRVASTMRLTADQMLEFGVRSIPVAAIAAGATGGVFALQTGLTMIDKLGAPLFIGGISSLALLRELGPVMAALMVAARMGSSITAEIGTMQVNEQVDALKCLGESPVRFLVVPRFLAAVLMMPLLTIVADFVGVMGAFGVSQAQLGMTPDAFWSEFQLRVDVSDITHGLFKSFFFGAIIAIVACHKGLTTRGGAEGVGEACTDSVVKSCMAILVADYLLTLTLF